MSKRRVANPLALAVLGCLSERPMHPYEMAATMRSRGVDAAIKLNYGSLYSVMEALGRHGLVRPRETLREGNRPERTVYEITEAGALELADWLSELISVPAKEFTRFEAGLALIGALPPDRALGLLDQRCLALAGELGRERSILAGALARGVPRLFLIEAEYRIRLLEAELAWVETLASDIRSGALDGVAEWRRWQENDAGALGCGGREDPD